MKKKIFFTLLACALFIPIIKASNANPTITSTIKKDGTLDFTVGLTNIELDTSKEYQWAIVANQAATPSSGDWSIVNTYTTNTMSIDIVFKRNQSIVAKFDTAYLVVREKTSQEVVIDHASFDVSIPYAYGAVPFIKNTNGQDRWHIDNPFASCALCYTLNEYQAEKITDQSIIDGYMDLKDSNGEIDSTQLADYINTLTLQTPTSFQASEEHVKDGMKNESIGITETGLYFVWGRISQGGSKKMYGVTIYDNTNGSTSTPATTQNTTSAQSTTPTAPKKTTSGTVESPKTGVTGYIVPGIILFVATLGIYGAYKKKFN